MAENKQRYQYPPPSRTRSTQGSQLTTYQCAACGKFSARPIGHRRFRCLLCKAVVEYHLPVSEKDSAPTIQTQIGEKDQWTSL